MAKRLNAAAVAAKWKRNAGNAEQSYKDGVNAVSSNPMAAAAAAKEKWFEKLRQAHESGAYEDGLMSVDFGEWKRRTADVGSARYRTGVADAESKVLAFQQWWLPKAEEISATVAAMPKNSDEDSLRRMETAFKMAKAAKYKRKR